MVCKIVQPPWKLLVKCSAGKDAARTLSALYSRDFFDIRRKLVDCRWKREVCSVQLGTAYLRSSSSLKF